MLIRSLLMNAARKLAADPRVQAKAASIDREVKPRAEAAWRGTKPKLAAVKAELQEIAEEADPVTQPRAFAARLKARFLDAWAGRRSTGATRGARRTPAARGAGVGLGK